MEWCDIHKTNYSKEKGCPLHDPGMDDIWLEEGCCPPEAVCRLCDGIAQDEKTTCSECGEVIEWGIAELLDREVPAWVGQSEAKRWLHNGRMSQDDYELYDDVWTIAVPHLNMGEWRVSQAFRNVQSRMIASQYNLKELIDALGRKIINLGNDDYARETGKDGTYSLMLQRIDDLTRLYWEVQQP